MSDTKELIARFRKLAIFDPDFDRAANLIEQQAKELSEAQRKWIAEIERRQALERELEAAQARMVVLSEALKVCVLDLQKWAKHSPDCAPTVRMVEQDLASTDTAAHTFLPKYVEPTSCGRCDYDEAEGGLIEQCPKCKAIDAEKEKP